MNRHDAHPTTTLASVAGRDADALVDLVTSSHAGRDLHVEVGREPFSFRYVEIGDDQVGFRRLQLNGRLCGRIATGDGFVAQWLTRGRARIDVDVDEARVDATSAPKRFPVGRPFAIEYADVDQRSVRVHEDLLREVAADLELEARASDRHEPPLSGGAAVERWRSAVADAVAVVLASGVDSAEWRAARRAVARASLGLSSAPVAPATWAGRRTVRVATVMDYLHRHAHEPLTVADIATAAGVSVRSLQETFQRDLQRSPMACLREVRLDKVRDQLRSHEAATTTVTDIARRWGFNHMGRFSAAYADRFGEYPRRTLLSPADEEREGAEQEGTEQEGADRVGAGPVGGGPVGGEQVGVGGAAHQPADVTDERVLRTH